MSMAFVARRPDGGSSTVVSLVCVAGFELDVELLVEAPIAEREPTSSSGARHSRLSAMLSVVVVSRRRRIWLLMNQDRPKSVIRGRPREATSTLFWTGAAGCFSLRERIVRGQNTDGLQVPVEDHGFERVQVVHALCHSTELNTALVELNHWL